MTLSKKMLELEKVTKQYKNGVTALDEVSLTAHAGEFLTILGESGSGKTTLLRIIAGLEQPTSIQTLKLNGRSVINMHAAQRNCATVFQHYALFPHMTVLENVQYGLKVRKTEKSLMVKKATSALQMVRLNKKKSHSIKQLSGGEKQRVALARALVIEPSLLLLDEPLGALDEKLRRDMQEELVDLHERLGITFVYITHSQEEALSMSDRIVLMRTGSIAQIGTPKELFDAPNSRFSAEFMGYENLIPVNIDSSTDSEHERKVYWGGHEFECSTERDIEIDVKRQGIMALRSERVRLCKDAISQADRLNSLPCTVESTQYRGRYTDIVANTPCGQVKVRLFGEIQSIHDMRYIAWSPEDCVLVPYNDEARAKLNA